MECGGLTPLWVRRLDAVAKQPGRGPSSLLTDSAAPLRSETRETMRELVDLATVERVFNILAVLTLILGIGIGATLQSRARRPRALATGVWLDLLGPANWLL